MVVTGNRGVSNTRLEAASKLLEEPDFGGKVDCLITHDLLFEKGVETLRGLVRMCFCRIRVRLLW